ncbi:MAG: AtpZ/AtpI family protein [Deltaproteobacteria bacterium]|jgi:ATP synthase protein I
MARATGPEMKLFDPTHRRAMSQGQRLALVGTELSVAIFLGLFGGHWLDKRLATQPWLTLVGLLLGLAAGFKNLYRVAKREQQRIANLTGADSPAGSPPTDPPGPPR